MRRSQPEKYGRGAASTLSKQQREYNALCHVSDSCPGDVIYILLALMYMHTSALRIEFYLSATIST